MLVLSIGFMLIALLVATVVMAASSVYLEHKKLLSLADGASVAAADNFTLGQLGKNTRNGTASQKVFVPNPGTLSVAGKGVAKPKATKTAVKVTSARTVKLPIQATGKKRKRLNSKGAVKVAPTITFTPTGGAPRSVALRVKLLKKT